MNAKDFLIKYTFQDEEEAKDEQNERFARMMESYHQHKLRQANVSGSCHLVNECHAQYTTTDAVFEDLQMALKYAAEQQKLADKCKLNVEYRVRTMPLVGHDG